MFMLGQIFYATVLFMNAVVVLSEDRFLQRVGWSKASLKQQQMWNGAGQGFGIQQQQQQQQNEVDSVKFRLISLMDAIRMLTRKRERMRYKRTKKYKRAMNVYQTSFGFRLPFQCLVDGTMIVQALARHINLHESIPKTLTEETKLLVTPCIINELMSLDKEKFSHAQSIVSRKKFDRRKCYHDTPLPARECILQMVGDKNQHRFCVASNDKILRAKLRGRPGIPLVHIKQSVMVLEPPSLATMSEVERVEKRKMLPMAIELETLKMIDDSESGDPAAKPAVIKRRKGPQAPNPLSCLKPKSTAPAVTKETPSDTAVEEPPKKKRKHRRSRKTKTTDKDLPSTESEHISTARHNRRRKRKNGSESVDRPSSPQ